MARHEDGKDFATSWKNRLTYSDMVSFLPPFDAEYSGENLVCMTPNHVTVNKMGKATATETLGICCSTRENMSSHLVPSIADIKAGL